MGQRVLGKMVWTFSVHTAIDVKKGSVINVVCYNGSVMNGSVMNGSVMNMVCYESGLFRTGLL